MLVIIRPELRECIGCVSLRYRVSAIRSEQRRRRELHVVRPEVGKGGIVVDRGFIRNVVGWHACDAIGCARAAVAGGKKLRRDVSVEPQEFRMAYAAAAVGDWDSVFVSSDRTDRSPVGVCGIKVLGDDLPIAGNLEAADQFIHKAVGVAQEPFAGPHGDIDDSVELDVLQRN